LRVTLLFNNLLTDGITLAFYGDDFTSYMMPANKFVGSFIV